MQCVVKRFATKNLFSFENIYYDELSFLTSDDEESWDDDIEGDPPYPTYHFDVALSRQAAQREASEKKEAVALWREGVGS
jgi:hypothetical protein